MARLVDADKIPYEECYVPDGDIQLGYKKALIAEKAVIDQIPTVDAAPVVHGRWEEWYPPAHMILTGEEMLYRCSACTAKYPDVEGFNYCPFCGAKMELEVAF